MILTGVAPDPRQIHDRGELPSGELVYLAKMALKSCEATCLITSLTPGWEQALAKAAIELDIPFIVALPYPGRDTEWERDLRNLYVQLLAQAEEVFMVCDHPGREAEMEANAWRVDRSDRVVALWEYEFCGETFQTMNYALNNGKEVINLWEDWAHLYKLRRQRQTVVTARKRGAQVY